MTPAPQRSPRDVPRPDQPAAHLSLLAIVLAGLVGTALVAWHFGFREFYYDCAEMLNLGERVRQARFLVGHGRLAGAGISLPPLSAWLMGALTWFASDPAVVNAMTTALNLGGFALALWYFRTRLPPTFAALAAVLLAVNAATVFYSNLLWEGSLLQPLAILFQVFATNLLTRNRPRDFFLLVLTASAAALCHLAGFMLLPLAAILGLLRRRQIGAKTILASLAVTALLFAPYAAHLLSPQGRGEMRHYVQRGPTAPFITHARLHLGMASVYFHRLLFHGRGVNLSGVMRTAAPHWGETALYLGMITAAAMLAGWAKYLVTALRARRLFSLPDQDRAEAQFPLPVQVAGFVLSGVALEYWVSGRGLWYKHFLIAYPAYALLAAWPFWRFWGSRVVRAAFFISVAASLALTVALLRHIERKGSTGAHGAMQDYGVGYDRLEGIRRDLRRQLPPGAAPELYATGLWKPQLDVVVLRDLPLVKTGGVPFLLTVFGDLEGWRISWALRPIGAALARHRAAMDAAVAAVPAGLRVAVYSAVRESRVPRLVIGAPDGPVDSLFQRFAMRGSTGSYLPRGTIAPGTDYIALDTNDPRMLINLPPVEVWRLAASGEFVLIFAQDGIAVLRHGPAAGPDRGDLVGAFGRFPATTLPGEVGRSRPSVDSVAAAVRVGESPDRAGYLVSGPDITLPAGKYRALFRVRVTAAVGMEAVKIEVAGGAQRQLLAMAEIEADQGRDGRWREPALDFTIPPGGRENIEVRVFYPGAGTVEVDTVTLSREPVPPNGEGSVSARAGLAPVKRDSQAAPVSLWGMGSPGNADAVRPTLLPPYVFVANSLSESGAFAR